MSEQNQILNNLFQLRKSLPQNPVAKLDETNTILYILATKKEIEKATDTKLKNDYLWLLNELETHYQTLNQKNNRTAAISASSILNNQQDIQ